MGIAGSARVLARNWVGVGIFLPASANGDDGAGLRVAVDLAPYPPWPWPWPHQLRDLGLRGPSSRLCPFCSAKAAEDGCGHAGAAGHSDAGPAPGSWEVGAGGRGPLRAGGALRRGGGLRGAGRETLLHLFHFFSSSRWGTWDFSSCCCFSSLQLWAWSSLETWVSWGGEGGGAGLGGPGLLELTRASPHLPPPECDETHPCEGLGRHATFRNFGMAFLTLFRVSTGDNWNGIMKVSAAGRGVPQRWLGPQKTALHLEPRLLGEM